MPAAILHCALDLVALRRITSGEGPMKRMPRRAADGGQSGFSERNRSRVQRVAA